jgi:hypothetical protein
MIDQNLKGLKIATDAGWRVHTGIPLPDEYRKCGCALSVAAVGLGFGVMHYTSAAVCLGLTATEITEFVASFDGTGIGSCEFAKELRKNCIDTHGKVIT